MPCSTYGGAPAPLPHLHAAARLRDASATPHFAKFYGPRAAPRPLTAAQALAVVKSQWDDRAPARDTCGCEWLTPDSPVIAVPGSLGCFVDPVCPSDWNPLVGQESRKMKLLGWNGLPPPNGLTWESCKAAAAAAWPPLRYYALQNGDQCW